MNAKVNKIIDYQLFELQLLNQEFDQRISELYTELVYGPEINSRAFGQLAKEELSAVEAVLKVDFKKLVDRNIEQLQTLLTICQASPVDEDIICSLLQSSETSLQSNMKNKLNYFALMVEDKITEIFKNFRVFNLDTQNRLN
jgi:hypothetical protein